MTRENRLIVVLVAIGVVGVGALALLAHHLQSKIPSVTAAAPSSQATSPVPAALPSERVSPAVAAYLAGRRATAKILADQPAKTKQVEAVVTGDYGSVKGKMASDIDFVISYKVARIDALSAAGSSEAEYEAVRSAYRAWKSGGACDAALADAFVSNREPLLKLELGPLEAFDDQVK